MAGDRVIVVDGVEHHFPVDATDEEVSAALNGGDPEMPQGTHGGLTLSAAGKAVPAAATMLEEVGTNPNLQKGMATVGRVVGGAAAPIIGAAKAGPLGALLGVAEMPKAAWAGGGTGWFGGRMVQGAARAASRPLRAVAPYAQTLSTLGAAAGVGDLAQMAEPTRKDIGFLGVGGGTPDPEHPALMNAVLARLRQKFGL